MTDVPAGTGFTSLPAMPEPTKPHDEKKSVPSRKAGDAGKPDEVSKVDVDTKANPTKPQNVKGNNVNRPHSS